MTDNIIATSGPSGTYPQRAYRNPLDALVKFLDSKHGENWAIWEFRAEGTGYPDEEVYGRVWHFPWPDHHPPPFALIPNIMASMRNWLHGEDAKTLEAEGKPHGNVETTGIHKVKNEIKDKLGKERKPGDRVVVVHCKAGKGRSGSVATSYLISQEGWKKEDALQRFTERRMRPGFGAGVSIPSQLRWIDYVVRWTAGGKSYVERQIEITEVHIWGLRDGLKVSIEGYVDEGRTIKVFHVFNRNEREVIRGEVEKTGLADLVTEVMGRTKTNTKPSPDSQSIAAKATTAARGNDSDSEAATKTSSKDSITSPMEAGLADVVYRPSERVVLPTSDINMDFERRNKTVSNFTMVTSVAHVWFNCFFEGNGPENQGRPDKSGVFELDWEKLDGIKGSSRKGTKCFDRVAVVWKAYDKGKEELIKEPAEGEAVQMAHAADWTGKGGTGEPNEKEKDVGLRVTSPVSESVSRASSIRSPHEKQDTIDPGKQVENDMDELAGVQSHVPDEIASPTDLHTASEPVPQTDGTTSGQLPTHLLATEQRTESPDPVSSKGFVSTADLPGGKPEDELKTAKEHRVGHLAHHTKDL